MRCGDRADSRSVESIATAIARLRSVDRREPADAVRCSDCYLTTLRVHLRGNDGAEIIRVYSWPTIRFGMLPADVQETYRLIVALGS